jgi:hypothetical protein
MGGGGKEGLEREAFTGADLGDKVGDRDCINMGWLQ